MYFISETSHRRQCSFLVRLEVACGFSQGIKASETLCISFPQKMPTHDEVAEHLCAIQFDYEMNGIPYIRSDKVPPNTPVKKRKAEDSEECPDAPHKEPVLINLNLHPVNISNWYYDKKQGNWQSKRTKMFITKHEGDNIQKQLNKS